MNSKSALTFVCVALGLLALPPLLHGAHTVFDFSLVSSDGKTLPLKQYSGKVLLIVNVASQSQFNDQIAKLEILFEKYQKQGFIVLAVPSNDFGKEEPEPANEVANSYAGFHLTFPLLAKSSVIGKDQLPLFKFLAQPKAEAKKSETDDDDDKSPPAEVPWNFSKYLVGRKGQVISRFDADVPPDSPVLMAAVEDALNAKPEQDDKTTQRAAIVNPAGLSSNMPSIRRVE
jgi:glutathione peroxidase